MILDVMADALGGRAALAAATTEMVTATGWRRHPGWGKDPSRPELVGEFSYMLTNDVVRPRYRLETSIDTKLVPTKLHYTETGNGSAGYVDGIDFMFDPRPVSMAVPSWRVAARLRHIDLASVPRLATKLLAPAADLVIDGSTVTLREIGRPPVRVVLDDRGLPARVELTEEHSPRGDAEVEVRFDDYRAVGALTLPHRVVIDIDGLTVHDETRTSIELGRGADFRLPDETVRDAGEEQASYAQHSTEWIMNYVFAGVRFYFDLQTAPVESAAVEIAPGVKIVLGPSHNVLVVEMPDHVVAVDAPLYDEYGRAALAQVKAAFPGKPLRAVVGTHFHYDHIGGIREFVADGNVAVIVGEPSVPYFEELLRGPHTVDPDRLAANPVPVEVIGVDDVLELPTADGGVLRIQRIDTDHSHDTLVAFVSKPGILFQSDLWNPTPVPPAPHSGRGRLAEQLYDAIVALDLNVRTIASGHRGTDGHTLAHAAPLEYLRIVAGR
ncbi:MBL fold metallo-hydrolase [Kutzneria buriramensis]|uniref:Glyoxylase-like metal-dependent hydrolase (Beta-lactamase superfamily II) n=1 Tax=Kutzneria buriramensis TaxID=1045776 RepID=A0A3E0I6G2_9PSEU|nr:MBL fold metallo-hydrolase [Kutzneria buriramensis]REH54200.1 glyoxylase-like metal-dependent hydrolase (beta-lactamase superfamily II) [Kutzneria buriramensis]